MKLKMTFDKFKEIKKLKIWAKKWKLKERTK
jgi:hypothetical protein